MALHGKMKHGNEELRRRIKKLNLENKALKEEHDKRMTSSKLSRRIFKRKRYQPQTVNKTDNDGFADYEYNLKMRVTITVMGLDSSDGENTDTESETEKSFDQQQLRL